jgi:hypothetical protein
VYDSGIAKIERRHLMNEFWYNIFDKYLPVTFFAILVLLVVIFAGITFLVDAVRKRGWKNGYDEAIRIHNLPPPNQKATLIAQEPANIDDIKRGDDIEE